MKIFSKNIKVKKKYLKYFDGKTIVLMGAFSIPLLILLLKKLLLIAFIYLLFSIFIFFPFGDTILFSYICFYIKYLFVKKKYTKEELDKLLNVEKITDGIYFSNGEVAIVIYVGCIQFGNLEINTQESIIDAFSSVFSSISSCIYLMKLSRKIDLEGIKSKLLSSIQNEEGEKRNALINELELISNVTEKVQKNYIVIKGKVDEVEFEKYEISSILSSLGLVNFIVTDEELNDIYLDYTKDTFSYSKTSKYSYLEVVDYPLIIKNGYLKTLLDIDVDGIMEITKGDKEKSKRDINNSINEIEVRLELERDYSEKVRLENQRKSLMELAIKLENESEDIFNISTIIKASLETKKQIKRRAKFYGYKLSILPGKQLEGFKTFHFFPSKTYKQGINTNSLASSFPFISRFNFNQDGVLIGMQEKLPYLFDVYKRGVDYQNSNGFVLGSSGAGKSYFLKGFSKLMYTNGSRVIILDPEGEYEEVCSKMGGTEVLVGDGNFGINPFCIYEENGFIEHLKMLDSFFRLLLPDLEEDSVEKLNKVVIKVYEKFNINENTKVNDIKVFPKIDDLYNELVLQKENVVYNKLDKFVSGRFKSLFTGNIKLDSNFIVFNFKNIFLDSGVTLSSEMLVVFNYITSLIMNGNARTILICDEAHLFIDSKYPVALDFFYQMSKRIRKYGGSFIPATQNISDFVGNSEIKSKAETIIKNSQYMYIFRLSSFELNDLVKLSGGDFLNKNDIQTILKLKTGEMILSEGNRKDKVKVTFGGAK